MGEESTSTQDYAVDHDMEDWDNTTITNTNTTEPTPTTDFTPTPPILTTTQIPTTTITPSLTTSSATISAPPVLNQPKKEEPYDPWMDATETNLSSSVTLSNEGFPSQQTEAALAYTGVYAAANAAAAAAGYGLFPGFGTFDFALRAQAATAALHATTKPYDRHTSSATARFRTIHVSNLPMDAEESTVVTLFSQYGSVASASVQSGNADVKFSDPSSANAAFQDGAYAHKIMYNGVPLRISWSKIASKDRSNLFTPNRNLWLGSTGGVSAEDLSADFAKFGEVEDVSHHNSYAFILFKDVDAAVKAKAELGSKYQIQYAKSKEKPSRANLSQSSNSVPSPTITPSNTNTTTTPQLTNTTTATTPSTTTTTNITTTNTLNSSGDGETDTKKEPAKEVKPGHIVNTIDINESLKADEITKLNKLLQNLSSTNRSIKGLKDWILVHLRSGKAIGIQMRDLIENPTTSMQKRVAIFYLIHDLLYHCSARRRAPEQPDKVAELFEPHLAGLFSLLRGDNDIINNVALTVIGIWETKKFYPHHTIQILRHVLTR